MKNLLLFVSLSTTCSALTQTNQLIGNTPVTIDTITSDMTIPWEIKLEGSDYLWVTERVGRVSRVNIQTGVKNVVLDLTGVVHAESEAGLLGLILHPDFANTPEVFLVYTHGPVDGDGYFWERLAKYTWNGSNLVDPVTLIDNIPTWINHAGSRLLFLPDNTLLMSTGERYQPELSQDSTSLAGKYLRVNMDGTIPADNPIPGSLVYTMGHRNSQGICFLPNGKIIISEHGPTTDDEISILEAGNNYGWPLIHGYCDESFETSACATGLYTEPIHHWTPTIATSDIVYYQNSEFPEWNNRVLMVTLNGQRVVAMELNSNQTAVADEDHYFQGQFGRLRDIAIGPNNEIYIATNSGGSGHPIIRITPPHVIGIDELRQMDPLTIVPNPARDAVTLYQQKDIVDLAVLSTNGEIVQFTENVEPGQEVSIQKLLPGTYYMEVRKGEQTIRSPQKFVKL